HPAGVIPRPPRREILGRGTPDERKDSDVALASVLRLPGPAPGAALSTEELADRAEPALPARRRGDERGRVRDRLVRRPGRSGRVPQHRASLERAEPARARRPSHLRARLLAHPLIHGVAGPADELPSL